MDEPHITPSLIKYLEDRFQRPTDADLVHNLKTCEVIALTVAVRHGTAIVIDQLKRLLDKQVDKGNKI